MTFENVLDILALIAFVVAAVGWKYRKTEPLAIGLALLVLADLIPMLGGGVTIPKLVLLLAFIAFVVAAIGWSYKRLNLIAIGLALWALSEILGPVLHVS